MLVFAIFLSIGIQLFLLTSVGVQGDKVAAIRDKKQEVIIENEIIEARILELQTRAHVVDQLDKLEVESKQVLYIEQQQNNTFALSE